MSTRTKVKPQSFPDGIEPARGPGSVGELLEQERAIRQVEQLDILVAEVSRVTGVRTGCILMPQVRRRVREDDARRMAIALTPAWLRGDWSWCELARVWHCSASQIGAAIHRHRDLMQTDRAYRALVERVATFLKHERDAQEGRS